jgi:hypothetical protein
MDDKTKMVTISGREPVDGRRTKEEGEKAYDRDSLCTCMEIEK